MKYTGDTTIYCVSSAHQYAKGIGTINSIAQHYCKKLLPYESKMAVSRTM